MSAHDTVHPGKWNAALAASSLQGWRHLYGAVADAGIAVQASV